MYELRPKAKAAVYKRVSSPRPQEDIHFRRGSLVDELSRQSQVFFDDDDFDKDATGTESEGAMEETENEGEIDMNMPYGYGGEEGYVEGSDVEEPGWDDDDGIGELNETRGEDEVAEENLGPTVVG